MAERLTEFVTKNCSKPFYRFTEDIPNYFYQQAKKEGEKNDVQ